MAGHDPGGKRAAGNLAAAVLLAVAAVRPTPAADGTGPEPADGPHTAKDGIRGRVDLWQQRTPVVRVVVGVLRKFSDDRAGRHAALIAYYGFFSVFPALLALVTVLGFVLEDHPDLRDDIADSALGQFPIIGDQIAATVGDPLTGSPLALAIGLGGALWAGMGMVQACQDAMNEVWDVERADLPNFVWKRLRSMLMLVVMGLLVVTSTGVTQLVTVVAPGAFATVGLIAAAVGLNLAVFMVAFRVLTVADIGWGAVVPGAVFTALAYTAIQNLGGYYVARTLDGASDTYGTFAIVIGLLSWIFLIARMFVTGAEINVVIARRIYPRSLFGDPATRGDRVSQAAQVTSERMHDKMSVDVEFRPADEPAHTAAR